MKILTVLGITLIIISCNSNDVQNNYFSRICSDSLGFKIDTTRKSSTYYTIGTNDYLALKRISIPSDTFFFRIEVTRDTVLKIFEYSFYKSKETYKIYSFPLGHRNIILFDKQKDDLKNFTKYYSPSTKSQSFIAQVEANHILELQESYDIQGYPKDEYSKTFLIEYSNKCKYNILVFDNPYQNSRNFKQAKYLVNFLEYLKKEFNF